MKNIINKISPILISSVLVFFLYQQQLWPFDVYSLEVSTQAETSRCEGIVNRLNKLHTPGQGWVSKSEKTLWREIKNAEIVFKHIQGIENEDHYSISLYLNYDKQLEENFLKNFNEYIKSKNIDFSEGLDFLHYFKYLLTIDNENALYVCNILNDITYYTDTEKSHRQVINLLLEIP